MEAHPKVRELKDWFGEDELDACPGCGAAAVTTTDAASTVCLECGEVTSPAGTIVPAMVEAEPPIS
jgi:hypothetical protein